MRRTDRWLIAAALAFPLFTMGSSASAATDPVVQAIFEGRQSGAVDGDPTLTVVGSFLTKFHSFQLLHADDSAAGAVTLVVKSKSMLVLALPSATVPGDYKIRMGHGKRTAPTWTEHAFTCTLGAPKPGSVSLESLSANLAGSIVFQEAWTTSGADVYRPGGRVGVGTTAPAADLHVNGVDGVLFAGAFGSGTIPATGTGDRMMWYPGKAAFRAGHVNGSQWDDVKVGVYSTAMGGSTTASGDYSTSMGRDTTAGGNHSTAMGVGTTASGNVSTAMGGDTIASGSFSTALGGGATASGNISTALGDGTTASGDTSTAMGYRTAAGATYSTSMGNQTIASGNVSTALGSMTIASGPISTAMGGGTTASGYGSTAMGDYTTAQAYGSLVLGRYNVVSGTAFSWVATEPVLVVGNGTGTGASAANAFTLLKNGNLTIAGTLTQASDLRMKKDVVALTGVLARIAGIRGVSYAFKDATRSPGGRQIGLVAQEVQAAFPELVREDAQGTLSVSYQNFTAVLLEAVKEQQATLETKETEIAEVRRELAETRKSMEETRKAMEATNLAMQERLERVEKLLGK